MDFIKKIYVFGVRYWDDLFLLKLRSLVAISYFLTFVIYAFLVRKSKFRVYGY